MSDPSKRPPVIHTSQSQPDERIVRDGDGWQHRLPCGSLIRWRRKGTVWAHEWDNVPLPSSLNRQGRGITQG